MSNIAVYKQSRENQNDCNLFVFGYSSNIFRDDEKAMELDQGKHLIPWIGNENIKIDRYDVRGYLNNLPSCETNTSEYSLSNEESHIEELCDSERYRALFYDEEEEFKKVKQTSEYGQVSYKYSNCGTNAKYSKYFDIFKPSPGLKIPQNIVLPPSKNVGYIIDRTANCVAKHGRQMEIIIKTRQAKNEKFGFLNPKSKLNPYYEYVLNKIKRGYHGVVKNNSNRETASLNSTERFKYCTESAPIVPPSSYKPPIECPYNMLVNKIHSFQKCEGQSQYKVETDSMLPKCEK